MAFNMQRRRSSWFGPQFTLQSFSFNSFAPSSSRSSSISDARRDSKARDSKPRHASVQRLANEEPLFHESYLSSDEDLTSVKPPELPKWSSYDDDLAPDETLEELGLALDNDEDCQIVATFISIVNVGRPKVVDISPPASIRDHPSPRLLRPSAFEDKASIYWRMPSYESSSRSSSIYSKSDRTESFDSRSSSSLSEEPKTPDFGASFISSIPSEELHITPVRRSSIPERARTLRRQSKNLSVALSKTLLTKLKDAPPPPPVHAQHLTVEPPARQSLPRGVAKRATTYDFYAYQSQTPPPLALGRKKSVDNVWSQR